jgi:hypothetical protein
MSAEEVVADLTALCVKLATGHMRNALTAHLRAGHSPHTFDFKKGMRDAIEASAKVLRMGAELVEKSL